ncbi:hypothetical protein Hanom_Chr15g01352001 [Helianthus anomalus]
MMIRSSSSDGNMVIKLKISKLSDEDVTEDEESPVIGKRVFCGMQKRSLAQLYILTEIKKYNEAIQLKSFETMAYIIKNPPKNFKAFVVGHFCDRVVDILRATNAYREGLQVPGDVDNRESFKIRDDVDSSMIRPFVAFMCIRATGASNFTPIGPFGGFGSFLERSIGSASTLSIWMYLLLSFMEKPPTQAKGYKLSLCFPSMFQRSIQLYLYCYLSVLGYATDEMGLRQAFQEQNEVIKGIYIVDKMSNVELLILLDVLTTSELNFAAKIITDRDSLVGLEDLVLLVIHQLIQLIALSRTWMT